LAQLLSLSRARMTLDAFAEALDPEDDDTHQAFLALVRVRPPLVHLPVYCGARALCLPSCARVWACVRVCPGVSLYVCAWGVSLCVHVMTVY
jgi:hypothetical protein